MKKVWGILALLVGVLVLTSVIEPNFLNWGNIQNNLKWAGLYAIISIGVAFVIVTGGIDLSIGSVMVLTGTSFALMLKGGWPVPVALFVVLLMAVAVGVGHGLLITKVGLQPFVVTLCGLLIYRGLARLLTDDQSQRFADIPTLKMVATGKLFEIPMPFVIMAALALLAGLFLNFTVYGRYLLALGRNEQAARFSGVNTHRMVIFAYVISSYLGGVGGILLALELNSIQPASFANFYELYAIAGAVLGGCSLRGGEGTILGVVIGATVISVLYNASVLLEIKGHSVFMVIGIIILVGVVLDEMVKRFVAKRRAARSD